jgi:hypothetical protein
MPCWSWARPAKDHQWAKARKSIDGVYPSAAHEGVAYVRVCYKCDSCLRTSGGGQGPKSLKNVMQLGSGAILTG